MMGRSWWAAVLIVAALSTVSASASSLDAPAPSLTLDPASALPGATVSVSGAGSEPGEPGEACQIAFGQVLPAVQSCVFDAGGGFGGSFSVPDSVLPDLYPVSVCWPDCGSAQAGDPGSWQVGQELDVVQGVSVPDVMCTTEEEAQIRLRQALLNAKPSGGDTGVVISQDPSVGDVVPIGSTVFYVLQTVGQTLFSVPDVHGLGMQEAKERLAATCLAMVSSADDLGRRVATQRPTAGTLVAAGTAVTVAAVPQTTPTTLRSPTPTTPTTSAPTTSATSTSTGGDVRDDDGSRGFPPDVPGGAVPVVVLLVVAIATAVTGWLTYLRPRLQARWVTGHVTAVPLPAGAPVVVHTISEWGSRDHRFSWVARRDAGRSTIEENPT